MKHNFRKAALSTICMLIVAVMSLTGVTYAWFSAANQATVGQISMTVDDNAGGIEIATTFGEWKSSVDAPAIAQNTKFVPVSTVKALNNGALDFYTGALNPQNKDLITTSAFSGDNGYVKFTLYFRNNGGSNVVMSLDGSMIAAVTGQNMDIVKASRIGFVDWGNQTITGTDADTASNFTTPTDASAVQIFEPDATAHTANGIADGASQGVVHTYKGIKAAATDFNRKTDTTNLETVTTATELTNVEFTLQAGTYKKIDVYIWVEGQDADCQNDVSGEIFNVDLKFTKKDN